MTTATNLSKAAEDMVAVPSSVNEDKFFDFEKAKTQAITLEQLSRTHREDDVYGNPLRGIYHFDLFNKVIDECTELGYNVEVYDMFAAQNRDRQSPGVVRLPQVEAVKGQHAVEAHILRRVYANIRITDFDNDETTTNVAVAFHQKGIQIGFGPNVMICHNQCMLSPELYMSSYSEKGKKGSGMEVAAMLDTLKSWLVDARHIIETDRERIAKMKETRITAEQMFLLIGLMTATRVKADTSRKSIRENITYPLNQSQITLFTEDMLEAYHDKEFVTAWDMYNSATNLYKANRMDIPALLPQNRAMVNFMRDNGLII
ncbi:DUF932 domain-containing protein [Segatella copri]|jgi:hypothetical protein|uniref:DUF932 domain-containing protein n=1 Tax=Siphoviridae sp. ctaLC6 TaxID=2826387 RepID=A0A8S5MPS0_9CAUD|nr:DUF932 domain-containing protein [Segatella copri]DAD84329.1 MAG TPA: hypothetical protein [Siphoviridae sp. ctaLC6]DAQ89509.1 MAG TPA: hypothetical protein [Caudoviricetes sp.]MCP9457406.1 DUF932 domain-containing protein [Segatella copri]MCP9515712.1 DUF932 domain-containing protein [Segatella copri]MCP9518921.1 DUF932 domain-containing protein [Segatella copri]